MGTLPPGMPFPFDPPGGLSVNHPSMVIVFGQITYNDVFSKATERKTIFCYWMTTNGTTHSVYNACPVYNDMQ